MRLITGKVPLARSMLIEVTFRRWAVRRIADASDGSLQPQLKRCINLEPFQQYYKRAIGRFNLKI